MSPLKKMRPSGVTARRLLDLLIVIGIVLTAVRLGSSVRMTSSSDTYPAPLLKLGDRLSVAGLTWDDRISVLGFLSTGCPACRDSLAFYARLSNALSDNSNARFVIVSTEPVDIVKKWAEAGLIVKAEYVFVTNVAPLGIQFTPTLAVVSPSGVVTDIAVGRLRVAEEDALLASALRTDGALAFDNSPVETRASNWEATLAKQPNTLGVDVRSRDAYERGHREGMRNVPLDELSTRATIELPRTSTIVLDCSYVRSVAGCRSAGFELRDLGFERVLLLVP